MTLDRNWFGKAFCTVGEDCPEYLAGHRSALFVFAASAPTLLECVALVDKVSNDNQLHIVGFEYLFQKEYMDRELSIYEQQLESALDSYPVQFKNVHYALPDA